MQFYQCTIWYDMIMGAKFRRVDKIFSQNFYTPEIAAARCPCAVLQPAAKVQSSDLSFIYYCGLQYLNMQQMLNHPSVHYLIGKAYI